MAETIAVQENSISFMLPGMSSPEVDSATLNFNGNRVVRFDSECVLIPEVLQKRPSLMVTKSYSLPLWKRRANNPQSDEDVDDGAPGSSTSVPALSSSDDSRSSPRLVIKVPIPLFRRKSSRSPTRGRSVSLSPVITKRPPSCLVDKTTSPIVAPLSPVRRPSLQIYHRRKEDVTVPLRACCEACEHATEESLKEGENWHEKFSRGAKRRRSGSLDNHDINSLFKAHTHAKPPSAFSKEFAALSASLDEASSSSPPPSRYGASSVFTLTVDEVDKRRKSLDINREPLQPFCASPPSPSPLDDGSFPSSSSTPPSSTQSPRSLHPISTSQRYPRSLGIGLGKQPDSSSSISTSSSQTVEVLLPEIIDPRHRLRSSPIEEEDEAQLFPLPSPRRSPSGTPSPRLSPNPSPRASSTSLVPNPVGVGTPPAGAGSAGSGTGPQRSVSVSASLPSSVKEKQKESVESNTKLNSSQESLLKASFSRKPASSPSSSGAATQPTSLPRSPSPLSAATPIGDGNLDQVELPLKRLSLQGLKISTNTSERASNLGPTSPKGPRPPLSRSSSSFERTRGMATATQPAPTQSQLPSSSTSQTENGRGVSFPVDNGLKSTSTQPKLPLVPLRHSTLEPSSSNSSSSSSSSIPVVSTPPSSTPIPLSMTAPIPIPIPKHHDHDAPTHSHTHSHFSIHSPFHTVHTPTHHNQPQTQTHERSSSSSSQHHSHSHSHSHSLSSHASSEGLNNGNGNGTTPTQKRKHSFSTSFLRAGEALREAGVDMLKGVSSMSGPGVV